jgi:hypothetical protein
MQTSLVILIVMIVIVLAVILISSDSCKSALSHAFNRKSKVKAIGPSPAGELPVAQPKKQLIKPRTSPKKVVAGNPKKISTIAAKPATKLNKPARNSSMGTIKGDIVQMFSPQPDGAEEFGVSESTLESLAAEYRRRHIDVPKESRVRHRSFRRSALEAAEAKLQETYMHMASDARHKHDEDFVTESFRQNILQAESRKPLTGRAVRERKFVPTKDN